MKRLKGTFCVIKNSLFLITFLLISDKYCVIIEREIEIAIEILVLSPWLRLTMSKQRYQLQSRTDQT